MTKIKICGITNRTEILCLNRCKPDFAGFVFAKSRRQVSPEQAAELGAGLLPVIKKVGVFVDEPAERVADTAVTAELDAVQLHGCEDGPYIKMLRYKLKLGTEIWKALRIDARHIPAPGAIHGLEADRLLVDTYESGTPGGTGRCFDWGLVPLLGTGLPVILAGGLHPRNVQEAIRQTAPYAVDTSSGVETDGQKDEQKLQAFVKAVRGGQV